MFNDVQCQGEVITQRELIFPKPSFNFMQKPPGPCETSSDLRILNRPKNSPETPKGETSNPEPRTPIYNPKSYTLHSEGEV